MRRRRGIAAPRQYVGPCDCAGRRWANGPQRPLDLAVVPGRAHDHGARAQYHQAECPQGRPRAAQHQCQRGDWNEDEIKIEQQVDCNSPGAALEPHSGGGKIAPASYRLPVARFVQDNGKGRSRIRHTLVIEDDAELALATRFKTECPRLDVKYPLEADRLDVHLLSPMVA